MVEINIFMLSYLYFLLGHLLSLNGGSFLFIELKL